MTNMNQVDVTKLGLRYRKPKRKPSGLKSALKRDTEKEKQNMNLLWSCHNDYMQLAEKRREHLRFMRYYGGDQWGDLVDDPDNKGKKITERELFSRTGITPITHNILQQYIRNVLGQLLTNNYKTIINARREEDAQAAEMLTNAVQACLEVNEVSSIDINVIMALHTIGTVAAKVTYTAWDERNCTDGRIDYVNEQRIAWNQDVEDPRLFDVRRITELHSYTMNELIANFAQTKEDEQLLRNLAFTISQTDRERLEEVNPTAKSVLGSMDFWSNAAETNKYRVIEVWYRCGRWVLWTNDRASFGRPKEYITNVEAVKYKVEEENRRRILQGTGAGIAVEDIPLIEMEERYEHYWNCKFLTPQGVCLKELESPYEHGSHPYVFATMPIIDGESKPLFSDLVDMQRNINRQRTMLDMLIASSAKNTLFIPEDALDGQTLEQYADEIMKINGIIKFKPKAGVPMPQFLQRNAVNIGIFDVLNFDMQQIQQISGLSGAIQGQVAKSSTPASLYAQQAQNTMLNFVLLFNRFNDYALKRDRKLLSTLVQYYTVKRYLATSGKSYGATATEYIPEKARAIVDSVSFVPSQGMDTPVFRQQINDYLMQMLQGGMIPVETFLQHTTLPFGKQILSELQSLKEQQAQGLPMNMMQVNNLQKMAAEQSDPRAMQMVQQLMGGNFKEELLPVA